MIKVSPSVLAADFTRLGEQLRELEEAGADFVHMDVMDGHFVPNITFGPDQIASMKRECRLPFDVHLMITDPDLYIARFAPSASCITVHAEANPHLHRTLSLIRDSGCRAGVALNPSTPVSAVEPVIGMVDMILIMTVNPGFGGQAYISECTRKIKAAAQLGPDVSVDGGINEKTAPEAVQAGAGILVAGSFLFAANGPGVREGINILKNLK